jgi:chromatin remodeling complex protein RSC6
MLRINIYYKKVFKKNMINKSIMAKTKTTKKTNVSKSTKSAQKTTPVKQEAVPASPTPPKVVAPTMQSEFQGLFAQLSVLRSQLTGVTSQVRALAKRAEREVKLAQKAGKKKRRSGNKAPSGFVKPAKISDELASFLKVAKGTEMARTKVTKEINAYVHQHKLQDPKNGRVILADKKLRELLRLKKGEELTYFNLQKYMKHHFESSKSKLQTSQ